MPSNTILNGRIEKTDLPTLLRTAEKEKLSGELSFQRQGGERIDLYYLFGQLYHSKWGDVIGIDAISELLNWKTGNYVFTEGIIPAQASINDDIERILSSTPSNQKPVTAGAALTPVPQAVPSIPVPVAPATDGLDFLADLAPFDLSDLDSNTNSRSAIPAYTSEASTSGLNHTAQASNKIPEPEAVLELPPSFADDRHGAEPPSGGLYRTRYICLPLGEQMSTSLVATGPQLEQELMHLAEIGFTGYVLGGPAIENLPAVGICLYQGRFIHAFFHARNQTGVVLQEGEKAYRAVIEQTGSGTARFYWFYEISIETLRAAISLLTPPTRYAHLEVRIIRFKELLRMLSDESHTGCVKISLAPNARGTDGRPSPLGGECAYIPIFKGSILGLWTETTPRITNDGQLLQRFLNEPQAYLDLYNTAPVNEPGLPLDSLSVAQAGGLAAFAPVSTPPPNSLIAPVVPALEAFVPPAPDISLSQFKPTESQQFQLTPPPVNVEIPQAKVSQPITPSDSQQLRFAPPPAATSVPEPDLAVEHEGPLDDDERQLRLITAISRMESTWTQAQKKDRIEVHAALLLLGGFVNDVLSLNESVNGKRMLLDTINRAFRQEYATYRNLLQSIDLHLGRINLVKLLKEFEQYARESEQSGIEFYRETSRAMRIVIRSNFQNYVSLIRKDTLRFECQEMYEVFLQDVVKRI
jgi:hypothetical protein